MEEAFNFDDLSLYLCGFCAGRFPFRDLIRHLTDQHTNRQHPDRHLHYLWCKLCSPLPRDTQQTGNSFQSDMREVSDRTYLPAGVCYNPSTNFLCATNEWHNDAYYGYSNTPINGYITTGPMYGYSVNATGVLQLSNMQSNFNGIPFQATAHVNYHFPMLNNEAPHANIAYAQSPLEAMNNEAQRVEGEIPNSEGTESQSEVTNGEIPTPDPACAESQSEVTNGEMPTQDPACAEYRSEVTNGEMPTQDPACAESRSEVTNCEMQTTESSSEATKQEIPHREDTTTCAESPSEATNETISTRKDSADADLRSDAANEMSCVVVTNIVSRSVASNDVSHVKNLTYVEPQTVVVKPEIVSKYKDDSHVVAGLNQIKFSESDNTAFQKNPNSNLPRMRNSSINREGSHYNQFNVFANNSQDQRGRGLNYSSNINGNSIGNNRNGYRNSHRGGNNHNFNNTRGRGGYQNGNDHISYRNHNSRRGSHKSTEYVSDNYLNPQRNKYNSFENRSNQRNGRSNHDSSAVANKSRGGDRNNGGLNSTHGSENEQNSRIRENVKFTNVSSGPSKGSYSEVVKRKLQTR